VRAQCPQRREWSSWERALREISATELAPRMWAVRSLARCTSFSMEKYLAAKCFERLEKTGPWVRRAVPSMVHHWVGGTSV